MIEETIAKIITSPNYSPSDGDNLLGMDYDVFHCLDSNEILVVEEIKQTGQNECMFSINLEASKSAKELHDVRQALKEAWEFIQYGYFEASSLSVTPKSAVLRFITVIGENQFYVTGCVKVSGPNYERIARNA
ncbi:MAG: hypothetical protein JXR18_11720 [Neptuniibacter sp.]